MNTTESKEKIIFDTLRHVIDPEIGCNIVDLGLVYSVGIENGKARIVMTLTTPGCPMHESIAGGVKNALLQLDFVTGVEVEVVWDPPWNPAMMTDEGRAATGVD